MKVPALLIASGMLLALSSVAFAAPSAEVAKRCIHYAYIAYPFKRPGNGESSIPLHRNRGRPRKVVAHLNSSVSWDVPVAQFCSSSITPITRVGIQRRTPDKYQSPFGGTDGAAVIWRF